MTAYRCPGCSRPFDTVTGLDAHRRHPAARTGCRYRPGEHRGMYRPGYLAAPGPWGRRELVKAA